MPCTCMRADANAAANAALGVVAVVHTKQRWKAGSASIPLPMRAKTASRALPTSSAIGAPRAVRAHRLAIIAVLAGAPFAAMRTQAGAAANGTAMALPVVHTNCRTATGSTLGTVIAMDTPGLLLLSPAAEAMPRQRPVGTPCIPDAVDAVSLAAGVDTQRRATTIVAKASHSVVLAHTSARALPAIVRDTAVFATAAHLRPLGFGREL